MRKLVLALAVLWCNVPSAAATRWTEVRSPHYTFIGDASPGEIRRIAQRFEQFHAVMQQVASRTAVTFSTPTVVIVFDGAKSFRPYLPLFQGKPVDRVGLAITGGPVTYVAVNAQGGRDAYPIVFHELAHLITANVTDISHTWLSEAIAEYYSTFEMHGDDQVVLGMPIAHHALLLRERFMPLRELVTADRNAPAYNEQNRATVFYAQSWAFLHYLMTKQGSRFGEYLTLAERGTAPEQALTAAFGADIAALERGLRDYLHNDEWRVSQTRLPRPVTEAGLTTSALAERDAVPHLAGLLQGVARTKEAEERLTTTIGQGAASGALHSALALHRLREGKRADALAELKRGVPHETFFDHYLAATALGYYAADDSGDTTEVAKLLLERAEAAASAGSVVPEVWRLVAYAHLLKDDLEKARDAITRALALAPANDAYRFLQVEVLAHLREFKTARSILGVLMAHGRTPEIRARAKEAMMSVVKYEHALGATPAAVPAAAPAAARPAEAQTAVPAFRQAKPGEARVFGRLTAIECAKGRITLVVTVDRRVLRITLAASDRLELLTYRDDLKGRLTCGPRQPADPVYVTWLGEDTGTAAVSSEAAVIEFTPRDYVPK